MPFQKDHLVFETIYKAQPTVSRPWLQENSGLIIGILR